MTPHPVAPAAPTARRLRVGGKPRECGLLPPDTRPLPAYYAPARGLCDLGF
jgi:hypothetical protein